MMTRYDIVAGIVVLGMLLFIVGVVIQEKGRMKSGVPDHVSVHQSNGKYYYQRGNPKYEAAVEITAKQYQTYVTADRAGKIPFFLGVAMCMGTGGWLVISNIVSQARSEGKRRPQ